MSTRTRLIAAAIILAAFGCDASEPADDWTDYADRFPEAPVATPEGLADTVAWVVPWVTTNDGTEATLIRFVRDGEAATICVAKVGPDQLCRPGVNDHLRFTVFTEVDGLSVSLVTDVDEQGRNALETDLEAAVWLALTGR